jgi:hypothetical protein
MWQTDYMKLNKEGDAPSTSFAALELSVDRLVLQWMGINLSGRPISGCRLDGDKRQFGPVLPFK